jgi:O-antigen/teichoic acid export membrane protein
MGIIKRQFLLNSVFTYLGLFIGFFNYLILLPRYFSTEQIGLLRLLISITAIFAQIAQWGVPGTIIKYFPIYKTSDKKHNGILSLMLVLGLGGCFLISLVYIIGKNYIKAYFAQKSSLFASYYWLVIPIGVFLALFNNFEAISAAFYRSVEASFLREVFLRITLSFLVLGYVANLITFDGVLYAFAGSYTLAFGAIFYVIQRQKQLDWFASFAGLPRKDFREILKFSAYCMFSGGIVLATFNIDSIMIGSMVGLSSLGVFSVYANLAVVIAIPSRAFNKIAYPVISEAWSRNDIQKIGSLYQKSSLIQMILALWIYGGICLNNHNLFALLKTAEYQESWLVFIFLGLSNLVNAAFGVNHYLLSSSPKYQFDSYFNLLLLFLTIITNLIFIHFYGVIGAAFATFLSMLLLNFLKWWFIKFCFRLQPFDWRHLYSLTIAGGCFSIAYCIPSFSNLYLDLIIRSSLFSLLYGAAILLFKIDADINLFFLKTLQKIFSQKF